MTQNYYLRLSQRMLLHLESSLLRKKVPEGLDLIVVILLAPAVTFGLANLISPGVIAVLKQIGSAITSVGL